MTPRQKQVYEEVCKGKCNKEVAHTLGISDATVKLHMTEILREHGVRTRYELIAGRTAREGSPNNVPVVSPDDAVFTCMHALMGEILKLRQNTPPPYKEV